VHQSENNLQLELPFPEYSVRFKKLTHCLGCFGSRVKYPRGWAVVEGFPNVSLCTFSCAERGCRLSGLVLESWFTCAKDGVSVLHAVPITNNHHKEKGKQQKRRKSD
jgi:hypothetical protein